MQLGHKQHEAFLAAALRGEAPAWPDDVETDYLLELGGRHGVNPLIDYKYRADPPDWPEKYYAGLADDARRETSHEILRRRELIRLLEAFAEHDIQPLIMKGAALAYRLYDKPALRPRCDVDLLIRDDNREASDQLLKSMGYKTGLAIPGRLISYERCYARDEAGFQHLVDLHWRLNNRQAFARTFSYDELLSDSIGIDAISEHARTLNPVHAVLLACMHRITSLGASAPDDGIHPVVHDRLIWLHDIHMLQARFTDADWQTLARLARERGVVAVVADTLGRVEDTCSSLSGELDSKADGRELSAALINAGRGRALLNDLRCLAWKDRLVLLRETLLPPAHYMRARYGTRWPLTLRYLMRGALDKNNPAEAP